MRMMGVILAAVTLSLLSIPATTHRDSAIVAGGQRRLVTNVANNGDKSVGIIEACKIIMEIMAPLEKERRKDILRCLPPGAKKTFDELQVETAISVGSLHDHLKVLVELGYIHKTDERPTRYYSNKYVEKLCRLATDWKDKKVQDLKERLSEYQAEDVTGGEPG